MQTKLVYVLTCAPEATYIEQALISIWSARYHNPDAHIVLIVDDKTNQLLFGKRAEILDYLSEKIVIEVPLNFNVMQASRWLKTNVRNLIDGDFLFIDCDTVISQSLSDIDYLTCEIGAVLDCHRPVSRFHIEERESLINKAKSCGWDFTHVENYRSSGILYVKDTKTTRAFYTLWHQNYLHTKACGVNIDQISLEKTSQDIPIVNDIPDVWNTIMFIRPKFIEEAKIIHFAALNNNSFLFSKRVLSYIKENGLTDYMKYYISNPLKSFLPYMKKYFTTWQFFKTVCVVAKGARDYALWIDNTFRDLVIPHRTSPMIKWLLRHHCYYIGVIIWMLWIRLTKKYNLLEYYYGE